LVTPWRLRHPRVGGLAEAGQSPRDGREHAVDGVLTEAFHGMQTVKAFTMEKHERNRFHKVSKECLRKAMKIIFYDSLSKPVTEILGMAVVFIALLASAYLVLNQETHIWASACAIGR